MNFNNFVFTNVTVVAGPPGAGKTTYVMKKKQEMI